MIDIHDAETELICPITPGHTANPEPRWNEPGMDGYKCAKCGEFSMEPGITQEIVQYDVDRRDQMSLVLAAVWNDGDGVAARLDHDGLASVAGVRLAIDPKHPERLKPLPSGIEWLTRMFREARKRST